MNAASRALIQVHAFLRYHWWRAVIYLRHDYFTAWDFTDLPDEVVDRLLETHADANKYSTEWEVFEAATKEWQKRVTHQWGVGGAGGGF